MAHTLSGSCDFQFHIYHHYCAKLRNIILTCAKCFQPGKNNTVNILLFKEHIITGYLNKQNDNNELKKNGKVKQVGKQDLQNAGKRNWNFMWFGAYYFVITSSVRKV